MKNIPEHWYKCDRNVRCLKTTCLKTTCTQYFKQENFNKKCIIISNG